MEEPLKIIQTNLQKIYFHRPFERLIFTAAKPEHHFTGWKSFDPNLSP